MHELGTVNYIIRTVENVCRENKVDHVESVTLQIGEVSGIVPSFIEEVWGWAVRKTQYMKTAKLIIENIEAVTYCEDCGNYYPTVKYKKICPRCKSEHTHLYKGNEYMIKEICVA